MPTTTSSYPSPSKSATAIASPNRSPSSQFPNTPIVASENRLRSRDRQGGPVQLEIESPHDTTIECADPPAAGAGNHLVASVAVDVSRAEPRAEVLVVLVGPDHARRVLRDERIPDGREPARGTGDRVNPAHVHGVAAAEGVLQHANGEVVDSIAGVVGCAGRPDRQRTISAAPSMAHLRGANCPMNDPSLVSIRGYGRYRRLPWWTLLARVAKRRRAWPGTLAIHERGGGHRRSRQSRWVVDDLPRPVAIRDRSRGVAPYGRRSVAIRDRSRGVDHDPRTSVTSQGEQRRSGWREHDSRARALALAR